MDDEKAIPLLEEAAKKGVSEAMLILGDIHADVTKETHTESDDKLATEWYKKSAKAGNVAAMTRLGIMYREARGVGDNAAKNYDQARIRYCRFLYRTHLTIALFFDRCHSHQTGFPRARVF